MRFLLVSLIVYVNFITYVRAATYHVLYIGNSLTYVNDVPNLVNQIAMSKGDTIIWDQNTPGGAQLAQHAVNATTLSKISAYKWDIVVIQAQSQQTAFPDGQLETEVYPPCKFLVDSIHRNYVCTRVMYYMPAGWKYGDNMNCSGFPAVCTYEGQFARIRQTHLNMIDSTDAAIIPSGVSYRVSRLQDSTLDLWSSDYVHPSLAGSYLTALNMYASFSNKRTYGSSFGPVGLTAANLSFLQTVADSVVFDSISKWKLNAVVSAPSNDMAVVTHLIDRSGIDINRTYAVLIDDAGAVYDNAYYFYRASSSDAWLPCTEINDTLFFDDTLCFDAGQLMQIVQYCGKEDTLIIDAFEPCFLSIEAHPFQNLFSMYPNPVSGNLTLTTEAYLKDDLELEVLDVNGHKVLQSSVDATQKNMLIDMNALSKGMYILVIRNMHGIYKTKFIKE